jgi:lipoprotein-anchoring transpeptidase ErfK/SrfK
VRRGRVCAAGSAALVTLVAVLGGVGVLPTETPAAAAAPTGRPADRAALSGLTLPDASRSPGSASTTTPDRAPETTDLPADSGDGKRVVFDISDQRVWLVGRDGQGDDRVRRTYLVSGSVYDNLDAGTYEVYSRSRWAVGIDNSGTMEWFVRFTHGANAPIGFHSIPTKDGRPLQSRAELGKPRSHGCVRQAEPDARRLWDFAPIGTKVVVTA